MASCDFFRLPIPPIESNYYYILISYSIIILQQILRWVSVLVGSDMHDPDMVIFGKEVFGLQFLIGSLF